MECNELSGLPIKSKQFMLATFKLTSTKLHRLGGRFDVDVVLAQWGVTELLSQKSCHILTLTQPRLLCFKSHSARCPWFDSVSTEKMYSCYFNLGCSVVVVSLTTCSCCFHCLMRLLNPSLHMTFARRYQKRNLRP